MIFAHTIKTAGIIAEYNPFHHGHSYQIQKIRQDTGAETIVVVMSGNFTQRGVPAWCDKYLRAKMALECGADFVFELPAFYATASAELFALGGVSLLDSLGFVDAICFGSECGNLPLLEQIAQASLCLSSLSPEENNCKKQLRSLLKQGYSYPAAHAKLLAPAIHTDTPGNLEQLLSAPNNILGVEYLKAIKRLGSRLQAYTVTRRGSGYHDKTPAAAMSSSSAVREAYIPSSPTALEALRPMLPEACLLLLEQNPGRILADTDNLSSMLYYKLRQELDNLSAYQDVSRELADRIKHTLPAFQEYTQFAGLLKTKQYTYSRICRCLLHILLTIRTEDTQNILAGLRKKNAPGAPGSIPPYARLLGFRREKSPLLRSTKASFIITKTADAKKILHSETALWLWKKDLLAADIYRHCFSRKWQVSMPDEYHSDVIIIP